MVSQSRSSAAVSKLSDTSDTRVLAWAAAAAVPDPEIPCVTVAELGILRSVDIIDGVAVARVTPTYSACPAVQFIEQEIVAALEHAGFDARVERVLAPAWTTDWISDTGRENLRAYGITPPPGNSCHAQQGSESVSAITFFSKQTPACPRCESVDTRLISEFGSTACKAHYKCNACAEPFDYFKQL
jgi:ring-1,2-phenylacetyl-CoA epoxidase subunit PaaD